MASSYAEGKGGKMEKPERKHRLAGKPASFWKRIELFAQPLEKRAPAQIMHIVQQRMSRDDMASVVAWLEGSCKEARKFGSQEAALAMLDRLAPSFGLLHDDDARFILGKGMENVFADVKLAALRLSGCRADWMQEEACLKGLAWSYADGELRQGQAVQMESLKSAQSLPDEMKKGIAIRGMENSPYVDVQIRALRLGESLPDAMKEECREKALEVALARLEGGMDHSSIDSTEFAAALPRHLQEKYKQRAYPIALAGLKGRFAERWFEFSKSLPAGMKEKCFLRAYQNALAVSRLENPAEINDMLKLADALPGPMKKECLIAGIGSANEYAQRRSLEHAESLPGEMKKECALLGLESAHEGIQRLALEVAESLPLPMQEECLRHARSHSGFPKVRRRAGWAMFANWAGISHG